MSRCCRDRQYNSHRCCDSPASCTEQAGRGFTIGRLLGATVRFVLLYLVIAFVAGTMIRTGNPTLANIGEFTQLIMFVEPLEYWLISSGAEPIGEAVHMVRSGVDPLPIIGSVRAIL